jgi:hypothetical protein
MTAPTEPTGSLALELERLRGTVGVGISDIKGSLALLVQRGDQTDRTLGEHRDHILALERRQDAVEATGVVDHGGRIASLERWMWVAIGASAALGTTGGLLAGVLVR